MNKVKLTEKERTELQMQKSVFKNNMKKHPLEMKEASHELIRQVLRNDSPMFGGMKLNGIDVDTPSKSVYRKLGLINKKYISA